MQWQLDVLMERVIGMIARFNTTRLVDVSYVCKILLPKRPPCPLAGDVLCAFDSPDRRKDIFVKVGLMLSAGRTSGLSVYNVDTTNKHTYRTLVTNEISLPCSPPISHDKVTDMPSKIVDG
jgi:hypothetical protein